MSESGPFSLTGERPSARSRSPRRLTPSAGGVGAHVVFVVVLHALMAAQSEVRLKVSADLEYCSAIHFR